MAAVDELRTPAVAVAAADDPQEPAAAAAAPPALPADHTKEDTSGWQAMVLERMRRMARTFRADIKAPRRNAQGRRRAGRRRQLTEAIREDPEELGPLALHTDFSPKGRAADPQYHLWEDRPSSTRAARKQVEAAREAGVHFLHDPFPCGVDAWSTATCADKATDLDALYPDPLLVVRDHYAKKQALLKARDRCADFVPFKCRTCDKLACAVHELGRQCPVCKEPAVCNECIGAMQTALHDIRAGHYQHYRCGVYKCLTEPFARERTAMARQVAEQLGKDDDRGYLAVHAAVEEEVRATTRARVKAFQRAVEALIRCPDHAPETAVMAPCCRELPAFTCRRCHRNDVCPKHEAGRTCATCKAHTVCKPCAKKDREDLLAARSKTLIEHSQSVAKVKHVREFDARTLAPGEQRPRTDYFYRENPSKSSMQATLRHELGKHKANYQRAAACAKHDHQ